MRNNKATLAMHPLYRIVPAVKRGEKSVCVFLGGIDMMMRLTSKPTGVH